MPLCPKSLQFFTSCTLFTSPASNTLYILYTLSLSLIFNIQRVINYHLLTTKVSIRKLINKSRDEKVVIKAFSGG